MPCPPCKIIINEGLIAIIAPNLADAIGVDHPAYESVIDLGKAAMMATEVYAHAQTMGVLDAMYTKGDRAEWVGCEHATTLMGWYASTSRDSKMKSMAIEWRREIIAHVAAFVNGEWTHLHESAQDAK